MDTQGHVYARYRDLLYTRGHGHPLWVPEPGHALPLDQKVKGISIGDVGILTDDGGFEYLWNVHLAADHPHNNNRVPEGFEPLSVLNEGCDVVTAVAFHPKNAMVSSASIEKRDMDPDLKAGLQSAISGGGEGFGFSLEGDSGAVLMLPRGAVRVDAKRPVDYKQYAVSHAKSWYEYINGRDENRCVQSGTLCLVTGTDKCSSWGIASVAKPSGSNSLTLNIGVSGDAAPEVGAQNISSDAFRVHFRTNVVDDSEHSQCVFLRCFTITVRDSLLPRWSGVLPKTKPLQGAPATLSSGGSDHPFASRGAEPDINSIGLSHDRPLQKSPAAILGDKLLNENRTASIVVVHDDDCMATHCEDSVTAAVPQSYAVVVNGVCTLVPEKPTRIALTGGSVTLGNTVNGNLLYIQHHVSASSLVRQAPPETSDDKQRLFALIIGINIHKNARPGLHNLQGAVADADDMNDFLISLGVHASHIQNRRDDQATHDGIIDALKALSLDDRIQPNDAIVIFFAGHGSQTIAGGRRVEMIIPHDFLPETTTNPQQQGILDTTIAHWVAKIAKAKGNNITVIFDSCHAGSGSRDADEVKADVDRIPRGIVLPEGYTILPTLLVEEKTNGGARKARVAAGFEFYGLESHVLLAACSRTESAYEYNMRGCFTQELLSKLRTMGDRGVTYAVTYSSLIHQLGDLPGQHPQCEGNNIDRVLFDGKAPVGSYRLYSIVVRNDGITLEDGGAVHGIAKDAEFNVYATKSWDAQPLCRLVAKNVRADSCDLGTSDEPPPQSDEPPQSGKPAAEIPNPAWALQVSPGERSKLGVALESEAEFKHVKDMLSANPVIEVVSPQGHNIELTLRAEWIGTNAFTAFVVADKLCKKAGLEQLEGKSPIEDTSHICSVLEAAADFFFHLRRTNPDSHFADVFVTEAYKLRGFEGKLEVSGGNLVKNNEIHLTVPRNRETAAPYGFRIKNNGSFNLYVWVFLFNVADLSIDTIYVPVDAKSRPDHSLPAGSSLTLGYGDGGAPPRVFYLGDHATADVTYLKIYLTTKRVNLSHIPRGSPFGRNARKQEAWNPDLEVLSQWHTVIVPIVQKAENSGPPLVCDAATEL